MAVTRTFASDGRWDAHMQRQLLIALGGGVLSAALLLAPLFSAGGLAILVAYFVPLPLFAAGLTSGARNLVVCGTCAMVILTLIAGVPAGAGYLATIVLPSWIVVYHALSHRLLKDGTTEFYTPGEIVARLAVFGAAAFLMIAISQIGTEDGLSGAIRNWLQSWLSLFPMDADQRGQLVQRITPLFPAFAVLSWLVMMIVNAAIAQAVLVRTGQAMRASPNYGAIELPEWSYWLFVAAAALKLVGSGEVEFMAQNVTTILAVPFVFVGLGVVHAALRRFQYAGAAGAVFYLCLFMVFPWSAAVVGVLGFAEKWAALRDRVAPPPNNQPEEE
jgi:hypothetical protein